MKRQLGKAEFCNEACNVYITRMGFNDNFNIVLDSAEDGMQVATATMWIAGLETGEFAIKNYSENEGMLESLLKAGIIQQPHRQVTSGFVVVPVARLTPRTKVTLWTGAA